MDMQFLVALALVILGLVTVGFGIRMVIRKSARLRILFRGNDANRTDSWTRAEFDQKAFHITLRDNPAVLYGMAQTAFGGVLLLINTPYLLNLETNADAGPYTKYVILALLAMAAAIIWQIVRNARTAFESDEGQQKIADSMNKASLDESDPETEQREL